MKRTDATNIFLNQESKELRGHRYRNSISLIVLFSVAIIGIGFGYASMKYLRHKMEDRFVSCLDVVVDQTYGLGYPYLMDFICQDDFESKYGVEGTEKVNKLMEQFYTVEGKTAWLGGRSCQSGSPFLTGSILSKDNVLKIRQYPLSDNEVSIIVSLEGLKKLNVDVEDATFLKQYVPMDGEVVSFDVPVFAVVKELPEMCDFMATDGYIKQELGEGSDNFNITLPKYNNVLMLCCPTNMVQKVKNTFGDAAQYADVSEYLTSWDVANDLKKITLPIYGDDVRGSADSIAVAAQKMRGVYRIYPFCSDTLTMSAEHKPQLISCYFEREGLQDNVEKFREDLKNETNYSIDMGKINNLKNLAYVQAMGFALSVCIIVLAILFICIFVSFLLSSHFQKIQRNLGTFKAFGMKNTDLEQIYLFLLLKLILISFLIAFVIGLVAEFLVILLWPLESGYYRINVVAWPNLVLLLVAIASAYLTTKRVSHTLLSATPGDLIYDRIDDDNRKK